MSSKLRCNLGRKCKSSVENVSGSQHDPSDDDFETSKPRLKMAMKKKDTPETKKGKKIRNDKSSQLIPPLDNTANCKVRPLHQCDYFNRKLIGCTSQFACQRVQKNAIIKNIQNFKVVKIDTSSNERITSLAWHPKSMLVLAVGSKWGEISLWNYKELKPEVIVTAQGPGGSIQAMKFDQVRDDRLYTASIDGTISAKDLKGNVSFVYTSTNSLEQWFTSLDVSSANSVVLAGDTKGIVHVMSNTGVVVSKHKLHKDKVTHIECNSLQPWLMVTSSLDKTVKLWDVRNLQDSKHLVVLPHKKPVNSAYFSPSHGNRILTTDQHSEINVFCGPFWDLETAIVHPHRKFQYLTPIKAQWHPLEDIVVVGRYPDPALSDYAEHKARSIDFFDAADGQLMYQLEDPSNDLIKSINQFNPLGIALASGAGSKVLVWEPKYPAENKSQRLNVDERIPGTEPKTCNRRRLDANDFKKAAKKLKLTKL